MSQKAHLETRRAVSYALRALDMMERLEPAEMIEVGSILSVLIQVEIARKNARRQADPPKLGLFPEDE